MGSRKEALHMFTRTLLAGLLVLSPFTLGDPKLCANSCDNGTPLDETARKVCKQEGDQACKTCNTHYTLTKFTNRSTLTNGNDRNFCENNCKCVHGTAASDCTRTNGAQVHKCDTCPEGFTKTDDNKCECPDTHKFDSAKNECVTKC